LIGEPDFREEDGRLTHNDFLVLTPTEAVFYEDWTGQEIVRVLMDQVRKRKIEFADIIYVLDY